SHTALTASGAEAASPTVLAPKSCLRTCTIPRRTRGWSSTTRMRGIVRTPGWSPAAIRVASVRDMLTPYAASTQETWSENEGIRAGCVGICLTAPRPQSYRTYGGLPIVASRRTAPSYLERPRYDLFIGSNLNDRHSFVQHAASPRRGTRRHYGRLGKLPHRARMLDDSSASRRPVAERPRHRAARQRPRVVARRDRPAP